MKQFLPYCFWAAILVVLGSCSHFNYSPNYINTPYLTKKGDMEASFTVMPLGNATNGDVYFAVSPIKNLAISANYFWVYSGFSSFDVTTSQSFDQSSRLRFGELSVGTYKVREKTSAAIFAGYGIGALNQDHGDNRVATLNMSRYYIQPSLSVRSDNDALSLGLGLRASWLNYPSAAINAAIMTEDLEALRQLEADRPYWMFEAGGHLGFRLKPVTLRGMAVINLVRNNIGYRFDPINIGFGASVDLDELFSKKSKKGDNH